MEKLQISKSSILASRYRYCSEVYLGPEQKQILQMQMGMWEELLDDHMLFFFKMEDFSTWKNVNTK